MNLKQLYKPTLILDTDRLAQNVIRLKNKCERHGLKLMPHFKTHQSAAIGKLIANEGIDGITVSSIKMAFYFAENGFRRIHLAMPPAKGQSKKLAELAHAIELSINISCAEHLKFIEDITLDVLIDIDPEYGRTGININDYAAVTTLITSIDNCINLNLKGLYIHNGGTYNSKIEILQLHEETLNKLDALKHELKNELDVYFGDTPGCSLANSFKGISHVTAGNFVFYDLMQAKLGSCFENDIAVCMAVPILQKNKASSTFTIHGGAVHFSKDSILNNKGLSIYGKMVHLSNSSWSATEPGCELISLSQEHGILKVSDYVFDFYEVGDWLGIVPVHSCLTADCMGEFLSFDGDTFCTLKA